MLGKPRRWQRGRNPAAGWNRAGVASLGNSGEFPVFCDRLAFLSNFTEDTFPSITVLQGPTTPQYWLPPSHAQRHCTVPGPLLGPSTSSWTFLQQLMFPNTKQQPFSCWERQAKDGAKVGTLPVGERGRGRDSRDTDFLDDLGWVTYLPSTGVLVLKIGAGIASSARKGWMKMTRWGCKAQRGRVEGLGASKEPPHLVGPCVKTVFPLQGARRSSRVFSACVFMWESKII